MILSLLSLAYLQVQSKAKLFSSMPFNGMEEILARIQEERASSTTHIHTYLLTYCMVS